MSSTMDVLLCINFGHAPWWGKYFMEGNWCGHYQMCVPRLYCTYESSCWKVSKITKPISITRLKGTPWSDVWLGVDLRMDIKNNHQKQIGLHEIKIC